VGRRGLTPRFESRNWPVQAPIRDHLRDSRGEAAVDFFHQTGLHSIKPVQRLERDHRCEIHEEVA